MLLDVRDLDVYYGAIHALQGISFHVEPGEIVTLIGANGGEIHDLAHGLWFDPPTGAAQSCLRARKFHAPRAERIVAWGSITSRRRERVSP